MFHSEITYQYFGDGKTWQEAKSSCEQKGGNLAVIKNMSENVKVTQTLKSDHAWLGANNLNSAWQFVDGSTLSFQNWLPGLS